VSEVVKATALAEFAGQLRAWRKHMSWTQAEFGTKAGYSASLISGIETMDKPPTSDFARAVDKVLGIPGSFEALQRLVAREAYPAFFAPVVPFEREAVRIHSWELGAIPGLLQTEDYARALIKSGRLTDDTAAIDRLVSARMERQAVIDGPTRPVLWYVIDEGVLRHVVGSPAVMGQQLDRLAEVASLPSTVIQVLPFSADNHAGSDGSVAVYDFKSAPSVGYTECYSGGRIVEQADEVSHLMTVVNLLRASALSPVRSSELIRQIWSDLT
jgi:transcriptional regulator with XRE-family HTH domain